MLPKGQCVLAIPREPQILLPFRQVSEETWSVSGADLVLAGLQRGSLYHDSSGQQSS